MSELDEARREAAEYLTSGEGRARVEMAGQVLGRAQELDRALRSLADELQRSDNPGAVLEALERQITAVEEELHEAHSLYSALLDVLERHGL